MLRVKKEIAAQAIVFGIAWGLNPRRYGSRKENGEYLIEYWKNKINK